MTAKSETPPEADTAEIVRQFVWQPIETAPKDGNIILLFGIPSIHPHLKVEFLGPDIFTAYWDQIDDAFCMNGGDWLGPFIEASHWMPLLPAPDCPPISREDMK